MVTPTRRHIVLLSGGVDSAVVTASLANTAHVQAVWLDYGQPAAGAEALASERVAEHYRVPLRQVTLPDVAPPAGGEIPHRNDLLIATAAALYARCDVALGIHAGTGYSDCSPAWVAGWQTLFDLQYGGESAILTPLLQLSKNEVYTLAKDLRVPLELTHSCEVSSEPCGGCRSCLDRRILDACS